jgi:hypothetical protein
MLEDEKLIYEKLEYYSSVVGVSTLHKGLKRDKGELDRSSLEVGVTTPT